MSDGGDSSRSLFALVGIAAVLVGLAFAFVPGIAGGLSLDQAMVTMVGAAALLFGLGYLRVRQRRPYTAAEPGDPETRQTLPAPGDDFDRTLRRIEHQRRYEQERDVRQRLRQAAVETVRRRRGCPESDAEDAVADGTWTDDPIAAAFFTGTVDASWQTRVRHLLSVRPQFVRRAERAAREIARLAREGETR